MFNNEMLISADIKELPELSKAIETADLPQIIELLSEKDDKIRYNALLLLQNRSSFSDDVYTYWDVFHKKLKSENSYQRSIGLMLVSANAKWDLIGKLDNTIHDYLACLTDEKPITIRQCIQALHNIVACKEDLHQKIVSALISVDLNKIKETMRKLILIDILGVLADIRRVKSTDDIDTYIYNALSGGLLDKKAKKQIEAML